MLPGGMVSAGLAIYDTMRHLKCDIATVCIGRAASMGAFLLSAGTKGKRYSMENGSIMIHQALGGVQFGQATDVQIQAENMNLMTIRDYYDIVRSEVVDVEHNSIVPLLRTAKLRHKRLTDESIKHMKAYFENAPTTARRRFRFRGILELTIFFVGDIL